MSRISCVRSTTRACSESSSVRCCDRLELVVDEQHLRAGLLVRRFSSSSFPLPEVRATLGARASLDELADRLDESGVRELTQLAQLSSESIPWASTATMNPRSSAGSGWRWITIGLCLPTRQIPGDAALPRPGGDRHVPVRQARAGQARARRPRAIELIDFGKGDPREPTDARIRRALADSLTEISTYPLAEGLPELRDAVADWCARRFGVQPNPDTEVIPTYGSKEAIFLLAQLVSIVTATGTSSSRRSPAIPSRIVAPLFAGAEVLQLPLLEENGFLPGPRCGRRRHLGARRDRLDQLPEQSNGGRRAARLPRRLADLSRRARVPARLRRGVHRALVRRAAPLRARGARSRKRRSVQHAEQALVDDGLPLGLRRRGRGADRCAEAVPSVRRHCTAGVRAACFGRRVERRGARRANASRLPAQARRAAADARTQGHPACRRARRRCSSGSRYRTASRRKSSPAVCSEHGLIVSPGTFFGPAGEGYWRTGARPDRRGVPQAAEILEEAL